MLATVPARGAEQADLTAGRVPIEEEQMLAVPARHRFARRHSVSFADLALTTVLRTPPTIPGYWDDELVPSHTRDGPACSDAARHVHAPQRPTRRRGGRQH